MSSKVAIAVSAALMSMSLSSAAESQLTRLGSPQVPTATANKVLAKNLVTAAVFSPEADMAQGTHRYLVRLTEDPVALYQGNIAGYKATSPAMAKSAATATGKLNTKAPEVKAYRSLLTKRQDQVINQGKQLLSKLDIKQRTTLAFNGMVIEMTQAEAEKLAKVEGIAHIKREVLRYPSTDAGPAFIQAPSVWDGSASGNAHQGEGLIVGVLDTGINSDHPSFADVGADGYDHNNPNGSGVYSGDCATEEWADLCNDKLIGVHSYPEITDQYPTFDDTVPANGVDHNGHGSHTAGTAAGNVLKNVTLDSGLEVAEMSGVAPHANIVSYQVCKPGDPGDAIEFDGCYPSLTILAVEHAIEAGVDVLNYSVGGGSIDPWQDGDSLAFLSARKSGIHVATSAGNDGPGASTLGSPGEAPWITTVGAGTHDRLLLENQVTIDGVSYDYGDSSGPAINESFTGSLLYAGSVDAENIEGCEAYAAEAFKDKIALISRGTCNFSDKIINAADAGASAVIVYNNRDGDDATVTMSGLADTTIASIFISENSGKAVISALADNANLSALIDPSQQLVEGDGGIMADFSSRGPNLAVANLLSPSITAPGVGILAPYADEMSAGMIESPAPSDYGFLNGTSMASPHIAGALTLLAGLQPEWTPAQAQSALMLTANQEVLKEDGETAADFFDMGSGYANVALAAASGLVMDESYNNYLAADPAVGGQPATLNMPSMANASCINTCSWTRTVTATSDNSWSASALALDDSSGLSVTVSPESFELAAGESQQLTITADVSTTKNDWSFANIKLTAAGVPDAQLPLAVKPGDGNLPDVLTLIADSAQGSKTYSGYQDSKLSGISASLYTKQEVISEEEDTLQEGFSQEWQLELSEDAALVLFALGETTAPDLDLYVYDSDGTTMLGSSATATSEESITLTDLSAGLYTVEVVNYQASVSEGSDPYQLNISAIYQNEASVDENVTVTVIEDENSDEFSLKFDWDLTDSLDESTAGLLYLTGADGSSYPISFTFDIAEVTPTAKITSSATNVVEEENITLTGSTAFAKNGAEVSYSWQQLSGSQVSFDASAQSISFTAPKVSQDETLTFSLTVTEANGNTSTENISVNVINRRNSGGSFGWLSLLAAPLLFRRMRK